MLKVWAQALNNKRTSLTLQNGINQLLNYTKFRLKSNVCKCECVATDVCSTSTAQTDPLRWGIAPVTKIADDFVTSLSVLPKGHHEVVACAACYESQAVEFAKKHKICKTFNSFKALAKCKQIDAVYISPLNPFHLELGALMLQHGKHVLCEIPLCMNEYQAIQLVGLAHIHGCFLLEAMWPRFTPAYQYLRELLDAKALGELYCIQCIYGLPLMHLERMRTPSFGGGVTMELGVYAVQFALWIYRSPPIKIKATGNLNEEGVDIKADVELEFTCGRKAMLHLSATEKLENLARINASEACLAIPQYWCPLKIVNKEHKEKRFELPKLPNDVKISTGERVAMCYQAEELRQCLKKYKNQSLIYNHNEMLLMARVVEEIRKQIGVVYPPDLLVHNYKK